MKTIRQAGATALAHVVVMLAPAVAFPSIALAGQAPDAQEYFLDFNDNQVPEGWTRVVTGGSDNCGVANGHFYSGETDSACLLTTPFTVDSSTKNLTFKWYGNVFQTWWGNHQAVHVLTSAGKVFMARIGAANFNWGQGTRIVLGLGDSEELFTHTNLPDGIYLFTAQFTEGKVTFTGKLNGVQMFKHAGKPNGLSFSEVSEVQLWTYETVGPDQWMDNVSIRQFTCKRPDHEVCP